MNFLLTKIALASLLAGFSPIFSSNPVVITFLQSKNASEYSMPRNNGYEYGYLSVHGKWTEQHYYVGKTQQDAQTKFTEAISRGKI